MAFCATLSVLFSFVTATAASAETPSPTVADGAVIAVSDATVEIGETFTVDVTISDNPGIVSLRILLGYDPDVFEITKFTAGDFTKDEAAEKGVSEIKPQAGPLYKQPFSMLWSDAVNGDYTSNGRLATLTIKVKSDAKPGEYKITPSQNPDDFFRYDSDLRDFVNQPFSVKAGTITVKEPVIDVTGLNITPESMEFKKAGEKKSIVAEVLPENATNKKVTYTSSDKKVATVDENGLVTAVNEGNATITVKTQDGGFVKKCSVKVDHEHNMKMIEEKDPTCTEAGNNAYYYCDRCKKYFKDEQGTKETTPDKETLKLKPHDFTKQDTDKKYLKSEATCIAEAVYYYSCTVCGQKGTETFKYGEKDLSNHAGETELRDYIAPTVETEGYSGDTYCLDCGEKIKEGKVLPKHVHELEKVEAVEATHFAAGNIEYFKCTECGMLFKDETAAEPLTEEQTVIPQIEHSFSDELNFDETGHWYECECGEKDQFEAHAFGEWKTVTEATAENEGSEERTCTVCGYVESRAIDKLAGDSSDNGDDAGNAEVPGNTETPDDNKAPETSVGEDNKAPENNGADNSAGGEDKNPDTGVAPFALAGIGIAAAAVVIAVKKRK